MRALDEAAAHVRADRLDAAAQVYRRLAREAPGDVRAAYSLAVIDIRQGRHERARKRLESVVALEPGLAAAQHNLGAVCQRLGDWPQAAAAYGRAVDLQPGAPESRAGLAAALTALGRADDAIAQHRELARDPAQRWAALTRIALIDPAAIGDDDLAAMQAASDDADLDGEMRIGLWFALGDVLDRRGAVSEAFAAYAAGNRAKRATLPADAVARANAAAAAYVRGQITPQRIAAQAGQGSRSAAPIFIVGFPRSGSTLIEQILASHPQVQGLGETGVLPRLAAHGYPDTAAALKDLAARYLAAMRNRGWDGASRFVDKTLENYLHVGLIRLMFPRASIVHAIRDPIDTAFACYRQLFASGNETLYDLADIAAEYGRYRGLMDHWRAVLPGAVADVGYETLVGDPQHQIRGLIENVGLAFDPAVLQFHERAGAVTTASASQVRRPIYASSVARWRRYAAQLRPLIAEFERLGLSESVSFQGSGANDGT
ncbi:tetratricopeptide repeat-containing sulfotransferase family protein [Phenylobacterium sp.]|uniref:tetratricopeptide repeat-containing sulfotransferase family protein n=1 Tax=Phenylobacterium sp. TaxID=1871053 RepID=UPI002BCEE170|nr:sulfotransferase [Phenylobacterium sp.]HLZ74653.1 sulfotransferase [Phenylobacterium sp.]